MEKSTAISKFAWSLSTLSRSCSDYSTVVGRQKMIHYICMKYFRCFIFGPTKVFMFFSRFLFLQRDTIYKCRVYFVRNVQRNGTVDPNDHGGNGNGDLFTEIEIPVYVAESVRDTCDDHWAEGIQWPMTKKVNKSLD